ncbi:hypothetical protein ACFLY2_01745 [Patescibacteria group bacterium]
MKKYISFSNSKKPFILDINKKYNFLDLLNLKSRVDLKNTTIRIVASNIEVAQHTV